jgi:hypothetical protein
MIFRSEATAIEGTLTRAEVYFGNVQRIFVRPVYNGLHVRSAPNEKRDEIVERFGLSLAADDAIYFIDPGLDDFVISSSPSWREAVRDFDAPSLFDLDEPWPPGPEVSWGSVD